MTSRTTPSMIPPVRKVPFAQQISRHIPIVFLAKSSIFVIDNKKGALMEAITFSPAQVHIFNMVSHITSDQALEQLREQLADFYAKQVDAEMDSLWELVNGISRSFNLSGVPISALLILNKSNVRLIEPHFRMEQELVEFLLDGLLLLNNTLNTLFEGSKSGSLNCFLSKSSIFAGEETEKVYDTDCTYSSQWRGLLPFYSCREDGVELPNQ